MSQEDTSNDVLSWLERRKKKQQNIKNYVTQSKSSINAPSAHYLNKCDSGNESTIHDGRKTTKDHENEDEEGYGHTQKLYSGPEVMPKITSYNVTAEEKVSDSNPNLHRKSKFGLPGITSIPTSRKVTTSPIEEINGERQQNEPLQSFGLSRGVSCPEILPRTSPSDSAVSQILEHATPNVSKKSKFGLPGIAKMTKKGKDSTAHIEQPNDGCKTSLAPQSFRTAHEQWVVDNQKRFGKTNRTNGISRQTGIGQRLNGHDSNEHSSSEAVSYRNYGMNNTKSLGVPRASAGFKPPVPKESGNDTHGAACGQMNKPEIGSSEEPPLGDERLRGVDAKMVETIQNEILCNGRSTDWSDIAGLDYVKKTVKEIVVFPLLRPDIFTGLRAPPKGILLFGPPGTGKTLIGRCIATKSHSTFFNISASSLTSKWIGDGEKMVRALFAVARVYQPSVIFIDEIDSLLSSRSDTEHESSRRLKTEFLVQLDGASTVGDERILIVGATNRPQDLDEAARRRLVKRLYVPLPEELARKQIIENLLQAQGQHSLSDDQMMSVAKQTKGYSGADMAELCKESAMGPIRSLDYSEIENIDVENVRDITMEDFIEALTNVKPSVSDKDISMYLEWNATFGSGSTKS